MVPIHLAVEDDLSEWVLRRILLSRPVRYQVLAVYGKQGFGYLRRRAAAFNHAARHCPFLLLTDLDQHECPASLIQEWLPQTRNPRFLLRIAVREVEAWLLGDRQGLQAFLSLRSRLPTTSPERQTQAKESLLQLAEKSPVRRLREALVWRDPISGRVSQGPDYNATLAKHVATTWNPQTARQTCPSLDRLVDALGRLETSWTGRKLP